MCWAIKRKMCSAREDSSSSKGTHYQVLWPKFDLCIPHSRCKEPTPTCPLTSLCMLWCTYTHTNLFEIMGKNSVLNKTTLKYPCSVLLLLFFDEASHGSSWTLYPSTLVSSILRLLEYNHSQLLLYFFLSSVSYITGWICWTALMEFWQMLDKQWRICHGCLYVIGRKRNN